MLKRIPILVGLAVLLLPSSSHAEFPAPPAGANAWLYETAERVTFGDHGVAFP